MEQYRNFSHIMLKRASFNIRKNCEAETLITYSILKKQLECFVESEWTGLTAKRHTAKWSSKLCSPCIDIIIFLLVTSKFIEQEQNCSRSMSRFTRFLSIFFNSDLFDDLIWTAPTLLLKSNYACIWFQFLNFLVEKINT